MDSDNGSTQDMIMVEWHDARFFSGTYGKKECKEHKMCRFTSLGFLIAKNTTTTTIAAECNNEGEYRDITLIPTGSIIGIKKLLTRSLRQSITEIPDR